MLRIGHYLFHPLRCYPRALISYEACFVPILRPGAHLEVATMTTILIYYVERIDDGGYVLCGSVTNGF